MPLLRRKPDTAQFNRPFTNTAAILDSIVSDTYYGMLRGQIGMYLPPEHPIIGI